VVDGALDAAVQFRGRPPELFAGIDRAEAPMPVAYPSSCSPQAWSSASVLLLVRTTFGLEPSPSGEGLSIGRRDLSGLPDVRVERLVCGGTRHDVEVRDGVATVRASEGAGGPGT
jgi:glycogen debranching enzyme